MRWAKFRSWGVGGRDLANDKRQRSQSGVEKLRWGTGGVCSNGKVEGMAMGAEG